MYLLQVYMSSRNHTSDVYKNMIEELDNILSMYMDKGTVIIMFKYSIEHNLVR